MFSKWIIILCAVLYPPSLLITGSLVARCLHAVTSQQHTIPTRCWALCDLPRPCSTTAEKNENGKWKSKEKLDKIDLVVPPSWNPHPKKKLTDPIKLLCLNLVMQMICSLNRFYVMLFLLFFLYFCSNWCKLNFLRLASQTFCNSCDIAEAGLKLFLHLRPAAAMRRQLLCLSAFKCAADLCMLSLKV